MHTAIVYARYSTDLQTENSIDAQLRACREYADAHNIIITGEYADRAISGTTDRRPEFQRAIAEAKDIFLVHKYDRFARDRYDHAIYGKVLKDKGVKLIAAAEDFGEGKNAVLLTGITQVLSEYYIANLREETKKGQRERALHGLWNGGVPPFGYDIKDGKLAINEAEAFWVKKIFDAALAGEGYSQILRELEAAGVRGKRGRVIKYTQIYEMLRNEKYTGAFMYCVDEESDRDKRRLKENCIRIENAHPAYITKAQFEKLQKMLASHKTGKKNSRRSYMLSGLVKCSCGAPMHANTSSSKGHTYSRYVCSAGCGARSVLEAEVNEAVYAYLKQLLSPQTRQALNEAISRKMNDVEETQSIGRVICDKETQIYRLIENMSSGILPQDALEAIGKRITELRNEIAQLKKPFPKKIITDYLCSVADIKKQPPEKRRQLIKRYISCATISETKIEIQSTFDEFVGEIGCGGRI